MIAGGFEGCISTSASDDYCLDFKQKLEPIIILCLSATPLMQKPADGDRISSYLVIELVVEEVFPQRVREVQDGGDDDTEGGKQSSMKDYRIKLEASTQIISRRLALLR